VSTPEVRRVLELRGDDLVAAARPTYLAHYRTGGCQGWAEVTR